MKESVIPLGEIWIAARLAALAMTERQFTAHPVTFATTNRLVILNAQRERIRISLKRERIATRLTVLAMTGKRRYNRASYFYATAKCLVIPRERVSGGDLCKATVEIRLPFCKRTDCRAPFGARNDRTVVNRTFYGGCNDRIVSIVLICKLRIIKLCIKAVLFKQLLVRALLSHPAAVHNKYAVGVAYC